MKNKSFAEILNEELGHDAGYNFKENVVVIPATPTDQNKIKDIIEESKSIVGLKPLNMNNIQYFSKEGNLYTEEAKGAKEFLIQFLRFIQEEVDEIDFEKTKHSARSNILYIQTSQEIVGYI